jgi:hypothetical protein
MKRTSISSFDPACPSPWLAVIRKRSQLGEGGFFNFRALIGLLLCGATAYFILIPIRSGLAYLHEPSKASQRTLSFEERVSCQRAIEEVYWRHRIWPKVSVPNCRMQSSAGGAHPASSYEGAVIRDQ